MRLTDEEVDLLRWIGSRMSRVLLGRYEELPFIERRDELGIVANMVARVARELRVARDRDEVQKRELGSRLRELEAARVEQDRLLAAVRELSSPVLLVHDGVLLVPMAGALDASLLAVAQERVLTGVVVNRARAVILDITGATALDPGVVEGLVQIARGAALLGARVVICGVSPAAARAAAEQGLSFSPAIVRARLKNAISAALNSSTAR